MKPASPWYREGLQFTCTGCGDCCTGNPGYVWVGRAEIEALARFLGLSVDDFGKRYLRKVGSRHSLIEKPNGDCVFYDRGCTVYPARPAPCRSFPFWGEYLECRKAGEDVAAECPGMNRGKLYTLEKIRSVRRGEADASKT